MHRYMYTMPHELSTTCNSIIVCAIAIHLFNDSHKYFHSHTNTLARSTRLLSLLLSVNIIISSVMIIFLKLLFYQCWFSLVVYFQLIWRHKSTIEKLSVTISFDTQFNHSRRQVKFRKLLWPNFEAEYKVHKWKS